LFLLNQWVQKP